MSSAQPQKRKRLSASARVQKPARSNKRQRYTAYHSSSSDGEDDTRPLRNGTVADKVVAALDGKDNILNESSADEDSDEDSQDGILLSLADDPSSLNIPAKSTPTRKSVTKSKRSSDEPGLSHSESESSASTPAEDDSDSAPSTTSASREKPKRHDASVFASSISHILSSKLTTSKRADPILSRSLAAQKNATAKNEAKLDLAVRRKLLADKKRAQDAGRVRDVLGVASDEISTAAVLEEEKRLRKMAQRGVVKLFNAVRQAQVRADDAERVGRLGDGSGRGEEGRVVGAESRKDKVSEMSKLGFLEMLGGANKAPA